MTEPRSSALGDAAEGSTDSGEVADLPKRLQLEPQIVHAIVSGLIGAFIVAVIFLVRDVLAGQALWTPHALGSALFLGEAPPPVGSPEAPTPNAVLVIGYTLVHGSVFVTLGLLATILVPASRFGGRPALGAALTFALLFVLLNVVFTLFSAVFADGSGLQAAWVTIANLLAAGGISAYLTAARHSLA